MTKMREAAVIDMFCGIGGMSHGFQQAGFAVVAGYDLDETCRHAFETNHPGAAFHQGDCLAVPGEEIGKQFPKGSFSVLIACCPCQPYSSLQHYRPRRDETAIDSFAEQVSGVDADAVVMENVVELRAFKDGETFRSMLDALEGCGYKLNQFVMDGRSYGLAQMRRRLIVIGSKTTHVPKPSPALGFALPGESPASPTIRSVIGDLPPVEAGIPHPDDPMHVTAPMSELAVSKIRLTPEGGDWRDWPPELRDKRYRDLYGDMSREEIERSCERPYMFNHIRPAWDGPSRTIVTRFTEPSCGPFIHPGQDRMYTLREGARLQGFPDSFSFCPGEPAWRDVSRHIGNAVPPPFGRAIAEQIAASEGLRTR